MESSITWFEIPVSNMEKSKAFYQDVFQCELRDMEMEKVKLAIFPGSKVSGALIEELGYVASERGIVIYLNIPDTIEAVLVRAERCGAQVITGKTLIQKDVGWSASFRDIDGNMIGLYESV